MFRHLRQSVVNPQTGDIGHFRMTEHNRYDFVALLSEVLRYMKGWLIRLGPVLHPYDGNPMSSRQDFIELFAARQ